MAESVDALVSNTSGAIHPGSIPGLGTKSLQKQLSAEHVSMFGTFFIKFLLAFPLSFTYRDWSPLPRGLQSFG